jgi:hypothetical protein
MTFPIPSSVFNDTELVNEAKLYTKVFAVINTLGGFLYGEADAATGDLVTLTSTGTDFIVPNCAVTFSLSAQRRVRIAIRVRFVSGTVIGNCDIYPTYVSGSSATLTGATKLSGANTDRIATPATGGNGAATGTSEHTVLLAAGTWTAFPVANRFSVGSATDRADSGYVAVYDAGAS